jgi:prepilin-type N-terminal cleavage/methylation domain-containing protein
LHGSLIMEETRRSGFTLIELLITVALVALLAGMALLQELRQARNRALISQQSVYFSFSAGAPGTDWCYGWRERSACDCRLTATGPGGCVGAGAGAQPLHRRLAADFPGVTLRPPRAMGRYTLQFAPIRGTASGASITLGNRAGEVRVILSPLGRVRACAGTGHAFSPC